MDNIQTSINYDYTPLAASNEEMPYQTNWPEPTPIISDKRQLEYILDRSARKLRYKSQRTEDYVNKVNAIIDTLNETPPDIIASVTTHKFYISIRNIVRDLLYDWHLSYQLNEDEIYLLRNGVSFLHHLVHMVGDVTKLTSWLVDPALMNTLVECMSSIDQLLYNNIEKKNFKQLARLFDVFNIYYQRLPLKMQNEGGLHRLLDATMDCLVSANYERVFRKLKADTQSMTSEQKFFLIKCPSFVSSYRGIESAKIIEQLLDTMVPRYASLLDKHIQSISQWQPPIIHAIHHMLLSIAHVRAYLTPYANGQPLQWLIDHIIRIISEFSFTEKVNEKASTPEAMLIQSALRTLTAFVHEPDLLAYIKQLKITSTFRSLLLLPNESIVLHAYVMLAYTLEEDDIKASEKDSGRLLSKIFDLLRKKIKSLSMNNKNEEMTERNIILLMEAVHALVQHDQIKSEILKQNALPLLVNSCQHFSDRSKRLVLESLGSITFDEEAARVLRDNRQFMQSIEEMQKSTDDGIRKAAEKIIWNVVKEPERERKTAKEKLESNDKKDDKEKKEEHQHDIMISYCHSDKELVYRIHKFLSDKGFKIWFDRDNIYGPAMQAMADAVENADFVILCMSDSYKRSVYCQAEAEYAFRCKRRLLPVVVRQGYRADGWLGLIIGSRIYVDFGKLEFKQACELILKEITLQRESALISTGKASGHTSIDERARASSQAIEPLTSTMIETMQQAHLSSEYINRDTLSSTYRSISISQWTRKDVLDFLYDTRLHYMMPICELLTGHGLTKLFRMCQTKPSRFYGQLNEELTSRFNGLHLPIGIFTQFLSEMDRLISSSSVEAIERDALHSNSSSTSSPSQQLSSPPTPNSVKQSVKTSSSTSLVGPIKKPSTQLSTLSSALQTVTPMHTTIQTLCNVQITEQKAFRTESLATPATNHLAQSSQDLLTTSSKQTALTFINKEVHQNQQITTIPQ